MYGQTLERRRAESTRFFAKRFDRIHKELIGRVQGGILGVVDDLMKVRKDLDLFSHSNNREMNNAVTTISVTSSGPRPLARAGPPG